MTKAAHWEDLRFSGNQFGEQTSRAFVSLAGSDPVKAAALASHVLELLAKPAKTPGPKSVNTPANPLADWIFHASPTPASLAALRPAVEQSSVIARLPETERNKLLGVLDSVSRSFPR
ncbi:MAG: hypothetical protein V4584_08765 [Verrucomicrobiota bacterium]